MNTEERLHNKIVDRRDSPADWRELDDLALRDPDAWGRLIATLRDDCAVRAVVRGESLANLPEAPAIGAGKASSDGEQEQEDVAVGRRSRWLRVASVAAGWLIAAGLFSVGWWAGHGTVEQSGSNGTRMPSVANEPGSPHDVPAGEVELLRELAPVVLQRQRSEQGFEITYVRRLVERRQVEDWYRMVPDEHGTLKPVAAPDSQRSTLARF